jgi:beta-galactosidase
VIDRGLNQTSAEIVFDAGEPLDLLVENMGRVNFGPNLVNERKGITEKVALNGEELHDWQIYSLPLNNISNLSKLKFSAEAKSGPAFYRARFDLRTAGDTYLDMRGWGKGLAWINGHNLGRYWSIGPQQSLYIPAEWLHKGRNEAVVLDYEDHGSRSLQGINQLIFETKEVRSK